MLRRVVYIVTTVNLWVKIKYNLLLPCLPNEPTPFIVILTINAM
jgi:hypothetical protein